MQHSEFQHFNSVATMSNEVMADLVYVSGRGKRVHSSSLEDHEQWLQFFNEKNMDDFVTFFAQWLVFVLFWY